MSRIVIRTEDVRELEHRMRQAGQELEELLRSLDGALNIPNWSGYHRGRLEGEWHGIRGRLTGLAHHGETLAGLLRRTADAFEEADHSARQKITAARDVMATVPLTHLERPLSQRPPAAGGSGGVTTQNVNTRSATVGDPVDIRTGHYIYRHTDLILPLGEPFVLYRVFSSRLPAGWAFSLFQQLDLSRPTGITYLAGNGRLGQVFFHPTEDGYTADTPGFRLEERENGFLLRDPEGASLGFSPEGRLTDWYDAFGNSVHIEYPDPRTIRLTAPWGSLWGTVHLDDRERVAHIEDEKGHTLHYTYDHQDRLIAFTDRRGHTTRYDYNDLGYLTRIIGPDGTVLVENEYDDQGRVLRQRDALGHETRFAYEFSPEWPHRIQGATVTYPDGVRVHYTLQQGEVVQQEVDGATIRYIRDDRGRPLEIHDPNGRIWRLSWDEAERLTALTTPADQTYRWEYDASGRPLRWIYPDGTSVGITCDPQGHPVQLTGPAGETATFEYDDRGLPTAVVDPLGQRLQFAYDERGRLAGIIWPDSQRTTYSYADPQGQVTERDPLGQTTTYQYDPEGQPIRIHREGEEIRVAYTLYDELARLEDDEARGIQIEYDPNGRPVRVRFPNGYTLHQSYDPQGRPVELKDEAGHPLFRQTYDARGRLIALTDARGRSWRFDRDGIGNIIALTDRKGRTLRFEYDSADRLTRAWDPKGRMVLQVEYNEAGDISRLTDAEGHWLAPVWNPSGYLTAISIDGKTATAELDAAGQILRLTDERGRTRTYAYDARGHLIRETYPLGQTYTYVYDPAGRLQTQTLPDGTRISCEYDGLNRPVRLQYLRNGQEETVTLTHSPDRRSLTLRDSRGEVAYVLKPENVLERRDPLGHVVRYEFSPAGQVRRLVYPDGRAVEYAYDENGNLSRIRDFLGRETNLEYDESDLLIRICHPNGWVTRYEYDEMDRVVSIRHRNAAGQVMLEQRLVRDGTGRVVDMKVSGPIAERVSQGPDVLARRRFAFNELDQVTESDEGPFRYDPSGNLTAYTDNGLPVSLQYDLAGRLVEAHIGPDHFSYTYDAEGNRIARTQNGQTRHYVLDTVLDLPRPLMETDDRGNPLRYYIWGQGLQYAVDERGHLEIYLFNHRGDTLAVVDEEGEVVAAYAYAPYGQVIGRYGEQDVPFRFLGRHGVMADHDHLYFIRSRYYAPTLGRFTQPDWIHLRAPLPGFLNRYAYALDDPWNLVDVDGRLPQLLIGIAIGGVLGAGTEIARQIIAGKSLGEIDWASVGAAAIGGAVGGALTVLIPVPILGGAISGGVAAGVQTTLDNWLHQRPLQENLGRSILQGVVIGGTLDIAFIGAKAIMAGIRTPHGTGAGKVISQVFRNELVGPWKRALHSPWAASYYTSGNRLAAAIRAEGKVINRLGRDIRWGEEALKGVIGSIIGIAGEPRKGR
jgi:RHS repeat-associated protein